MAKEWFDYNESESREDDSLGDSNYWQIHELSMTQASEWFLLPWKHGNG